MCDQIYLCFSNIIMWHALIEGYKPKGLHQVFREFNFFFFLNLIEASLKPYFCKPI